jgi:hypothetical protein
VWDVGALDAGNFVSEDSDDWETVSASSSGMGEVVCQARRPSSSVTLGGFIARAEELGGSLRHRRRAVIAPGEKGAGFSRAVPRFTRLGDAGWQAASSTRQKRAGSAPSGWGSSSFSTPVVQTAAPQVAREAAAGEDGSNPRETLGRGGLGLGWAASPALGPLVGFCRVWRACRFVQIRLVRGL